MIICKSCRLAEVARVFPYHCICGKVHHGISSDTQPQGKTHCRDRMVGTRLKNLIKWFPVPKKTNCGLCNRMEQKMNAWGPEKCRQKMPYILAKLRIAAKRRGLPFSERLVRLLVEKAIDG